MKNLIIILCLVSSCSINSRHEIAVTVETFLINPQIIDLEKINKNLITNEFSQLIDKAIEKTKIEVEKVRGTTDKPFILDGVIFSSYTEGWEKFKIIDIKIQRNKATTTIEFEKILNNEKLIWKDEIILIKERSWKIDNIIFGAEGVKGNTKDILSDYLNYTN